MFKGKTYEQLVELEQSIRHKIQHETGIDFGYSDSLAVQLKAHTARARLRERHFKVLHAKLASLKRKQGVADENHTAASKGAAEAVDGEDFEKRIMKEQAVYRQKQEEAAATSSSSKQARRKLTEDSNEHADDLDEDDKFDKLEAMDEQDEASMADGGDRVRLTHSRRASTRRVCSSRVSLPSTRSSSRSTRTRSDLLQDAPKCLALARSSLASRTRLMRKRARPWAAYWSTTTTARTRSAATHRRPLQQAKLSQSQAPVLLAQKRLKKHLLPHLAKASRTRCR